MITCILGLGNNLIYRIHCIPLLSHDFGLLILSQWQNIVLLQLNNSYNICSWKILILSRMFLKQGLEVSSFKLNFVIIDSINE